MKHWLSVSVLSLVLCFLLGAWWGHQLQEKKAAPLPLKGRIHLLAEDGFFSDEMLKAFSTQKQIDLHVETYKHPQEFIEKLKTIESIQIVYFSSSLFKYLKEESLLDPLDASKIKNLKHISTDLRYAAWDPGESLALPFTWDALSFVYKPETTTPSADSLKALLKQSPQDLSLKRSLENLVWLTQHLNFSKEEAFTQLTQLPWSEADDLAAFKAGKIKYLQRSWSEIQSLNKDQQKDLGDFKIWYPKEHSPFFINYIGLRRGVYSHSDLDLVYLTLSGLYDPLIYKRLIAKKSLFGVIDNTEPDTDTDLQSAQYFRKLPLSKVRPLMNLELELEELKPLMSKIDIQDR